MFIFFSLTNQLLSSAFVKTKIRFEYYEKYFKNYIYIYFY